MNGARAIAWLAFASAGCGVQPVELAPYADRSAVIVESGVPSSGVAELAQAKEAAPDPAQLGFSYPLDATALPENLAPITFQWHVGAAAPAPKATMMQPMPATMMPDVMMKPMATPMAKPSMPGTGSATDSNMVSELHLHSPHGELRLYTMAREAALPSERWNALLRDGAGAQLGAEVRVLDLASHKIVRSAMLELPLRAKTQSGELYVWSTTAQGVVRAQLEDTRALHVAPEPDANGPRCGGCHTVSRDGRRLWLGRGDPATLDAYALPALEAALPAAPLANAPYGWASFDPTAARVAIANEGKLTLFDVDSGAAIAAASLPDDVRVTHPDWSPDGRFIALTLFGADGGDDQRVTGSSIARVSVALDGSLGAPEVLVAPMAKDDTLVFPSYSPDGSLIAFEHAKGSSKEAKDASLFVVAADGGMPIALERLRATDGMPQPVDSMPTWLPGGEPGSDFLVFSSTRGYGAQAFAAGQEQLFAASIDRTRAAQGMDPSAPAFWLPFQETGSSYHRALFAPALLACTKAPELCNGRDDDCDAKVDEDCCTPKPERCGDGVDNDCDGQSDEGCGCTFLDACGDGVDGDCDGKVDEDCMAKG